MSLTIVPVTFRGACQFIEAHHRHHRPPRGMKFAIGVMSDDGLVGVATAGRPVARHLDDGVTIEVTRTCTVGEPNANSKLYGAAWRAARAMGYRRLITYTQEGESGASLRAAGLQPVAELRPRSGWTTASRPRNSHGVDGVRRTRWEVCAKPAAFVPVPGESSCRTAVSAGTAGEDR
ncbi:XF1762 family protein [Amycolatopsis sp. CA-128772]|uniref:XF1762 family protein n=1 Tax=Amycolatopsis sp. CA-128772 TaxID=2073159 RepID=UPI001E52A97E|nr:XF1762 family protein [Amycolatopsis sp. CA-128772]